MNFFNTIKKEQGRTVVIGCGRLGATLASSLSETGEDVLVIDISKDSFRKLSPSFSGLTVIGNATSLDVLREAQINKYTTVACVTDDGNTNIMTEQLVKELFSAQRVITRLHDPEKSCIYEDQGIETICPSVLAIEAINHLLLGKRSKEGKL